MRVSRQDSSVAILAILASTVALGYAMQISNGAYSPEAFNWLVVSFGFAIAPIVFPTMPRLETIVTEQVMAPALVAALAFQLALLVSSYPILYFDPSTGYTVAAFQSLIAVAAVTTGFALARRDRSPRSMGALVVLLFAIGGYWVMKASPRPHIDVFSIHQDSVAALLEGTDPYTITFANPYHTTAWFPPGAATYDRLLFGYVYPSWTLLASVPGYLLAHDYRYSFVAAVAMSGALGAYARPGPWAVPAAALFLFTPRSFLVLEQGWTEPALLIGIALAVYAAAKRRLTWLLPVGLGIVACAKQYSILAAPAALLLRSMFPSWRAFGIMIAKALAVALVITLPLALWHPKAYFFDVYRAHFAAAIRSDALSLPTWWEGRYGTPLPKSLHLGLPALLGLLTLVRAPRTVSGFAWPGSTLYFIFFVFRQGFCNYYFLVVCIQALAIAVALPMARASARVARV